MTIAEAGIRTLVAIIIGALLLRERRQHAPLPRDLSALIVLAMAALGGAVGLAWAAVQ